MWKAWGHEKHPSHRALGSEPADAPATVPVWSATVTASDRRRGKLEHPWRGIDLDVYERHMSDERVGQLQQLHDITKEQLAAYPSRAIGVLGVAGGNGLDLIDLGTTDAVFGYDINADYLDACEARYRDALGDRLYLIETSIDRSVTIERVDLLIANLIIEYVGAEEFVAFVVANARSIGVLSCVIQRNDAAGFVSSTDYASSFDALASVSSDIDPEALDSAMSDAGFVALGRCEYPLPNGKTLIRQDFRPGPEPERDSQSSHRMVSSGGRQDRRDSADLRHTTVRRPDQETAGRDRDRSRLPHDR
jgi:hypothetical protein